MEFDQIKVVSIFGGGIMGNGIAQVMAQHGYQVVLRDIKSELLDTALATIKRSLQRGVERNVLTEAQAKDTLSLIKTTTDVGEAARAADLVVEALPEKLELKKELFKLLDESCKPEAIFASNTSTLSITEMASVTKRPDKFIGMHFMNPVPLMKLVEIIKGLLTSDGTIEIIRKLTVKLEKEPIVVKDSAGFATSRLGIALFMEASRMLEEGVASVEDIDKAMKSGYGHRMGPFETCDLVGLDARLNNINALYESTRDQLWRPPQLLKKLVMAGYLGKKPGSRGGYYTYFGFDKPA
jgi:3-hydroxybutyryl-CoA dehydrogenase